MMRVIVVLFIFLMVSVGVGAAVFLNQALNHSVRLDAPVIIVVKSGDTLRKVVYELERQRLLIYPEWMILLSRYKKEMARVQAGEYEFEGLVKVTDVLQTLQQGKVRRYQVALIEGETLNVWLKRLKKQTALKSVLNIDSLELLTDALGKPSGAALEGLFFPDTYVYRRGDTDLKILQQAYEQMQTVLSEQWSSRDVDLPYASAYDALIMASIIEKETGLAEERPRIAGVFVQRLLKNIKLQTDPTVIYGLGDKFDGNLTRRHLRQDTPFNTYVHKGLPPTPIASASLASIHAALHPDLRDEIFFVARGDGSHHFSKTLKEHNAAVRRYQLKR